MNKIKMIITML